MTTGERKIQFPERKLFSSMRNRQEHLFLTVIGLSSVVTVLLFIGYSETPFQASRQLSGRKGNNDARADVAGLKGNSISKKPTVKKSLLLDSHPEILSQRYTKLNVGGIRGQMREIQNNFSALETLDVKRYFSESAKLCSYPRYCSQSYTGRLDIQHSRCINRTHSFSFAPRMRLVHFDLKGAPPKVDFIVKVLALLKRSGATGILMEYEDMFPYWGALAPLAALNSYSVEDVRKILRMAKQLDLEVIPLVQTFGHLEYALKLPQFAHLRETNDSASALCPLNRESFSLIATMIHQVLNLHPDSKWLHIGCDEVFRLAMCGKCNKYQYKKDVLFLQHVTKVARHTRKTYNVTPIIWDDMIRRISSHVLRRTNIGSLVEPMVWVYGESVENYFFPKMWQRYRLIFPNLWAASAYKGAFGRTLLIPNSKRHLNNHISWLTSMARHKTIHFQGVVLTGWQRYEHFAPLCELFPAGLPSLFLNLLTVSEGCLTNSVLQKFKEILGCQTIADDFRMDSYAVIEHDPYFQSLLENCSFPASDAFFAIQRVLNFNETSYAFFKRVCQLHVENEINFETENKTEYLQNIFLKIIHLQTLTSESRRALSDVFDDFSTSEWLDQILNPLKLKLEELSSSFQNNTFQSGFCKHNNNNIFIRKFPIDFAKLA